jgi:ferrochelatase
LSTKKYAVVLLNLGGPDSLDAVEPFLYNLFADPDIINFPGSFLFSNKLAKIISTKRAPRIQEQYKQIGGKSPILDITTMQAKDLEAALRKEINAKVYIAMRYWKPFTEDTLKQISNDKPDEIILLPLYPQYSSSTTGSSVKEWNRLIKNFDDLSGTPVKIINEYYEFEPYIRSICSRINQAFKKFPEDKHRNVILMFSAHGTPMKLVRQGDPYSKQIEKTVQKVMDSCGYKNMHTLCFQSKVGPQKWLTPSTPDIIAKLADEGSKYIMVIPIAFTGDHLETLFELGTEYKHLATEKGVTQFEVTEGLNNSLEFIDALKQLVMKEIN